MRLTRALEDRIAAFDNICLRRILRISYMDHVTNADASLRPGTPPQLLPLIQTRRLRFFGYVAQMGNSHDLSRALHTSVRNFAGCPTIGDAAQDVHITPGFGPWKQTFSRSIMA